jgi:hypothetical protein
MVTTWRAVVLLRRLPQIEPLPKVALLPVIWKAHKRSGSPWREEEEKEEKEEEEEIISIQEKRTVVSVA